MAALYQPLPATPSAASNLRIANIVSYRREASCPIHKSPACRSFLPQQGERSRLRDDGGSAKACRQTRAQWQNLLFLLRKVRGTLPERAGEIPGGSRESGHETRDGRNSSGARSPAFTWQGRALHLPDGPRNHPDRPGYLPEVRHGPRTNGFHRSSIWRRATRSRVCFHALALLDERSPFAAAARSLHVRWSLGLASRSSHKKRGRTFAGVTRRSLGRLAFLPAFLGF